MLPDIISLNKSMQFRLQEYQQLLDDVQVPCSNVVQIWADIFEELAVISADWQALWILSEGSCQKYSLVFPTAVIVQVTHFNWNELRANVEVSAVQEDILLPYALEVPVIELHPIKNQNYYDCDLEDTEDWLDKCRYFFKNLWYPWDEKLNVPMMDWCQKHLAKRLKLQYDLKNGVFDKSIINYVKSLLKEAQNLTALSQQSLQNDERLVAVTNCIRRKVLKTELDLFAEPDLRYGMILLKHNERHTKCCIDKFESNEATFVWNRGNCDSLIKNLKTVQEFINDKINLKISTMLQEALDRSCADDIVLLPEGTHVMSSLKGLENGGTIKGFNKVNTIITPDLTVIPRAILLECFGLVELENLTISKPTGIAIQVFEGSVKIRNCKIISNEDATAKAIVVASGCKLYMDGCEIESFGTGVAVQEGAEVTITNSKINNCCEGIKIRDNATVTLENIMILSSSGYGIKVETTGLNCKLPIIGDLSLLRQSNLKSDLSLSCVLFADNVKGDVIIKEREKVFDIDNLSESSDLDGNDKSDDERNEVIYISDDGEMSEV